MVGVAAAGIGIYPAVGNHESDLSAFTNIFGLVPSGNGVPGGPGTYAFTWSNALFLVLNEVAPGNEYRVPQDWVDAVLATNTLPHVFVVGHMPAFKLYHPECLASYPAPRDVFWNHLVIGNCRIYFCGHDHFYDHARLDDGDGNPDNDLHQFIVGTGGAPPYADSLYDGENGRWTPSRIWHEAQFGFVSVEIDGIIVTTRWHHRTESGSYVVTSESWAYTANTRPRLQFRYSAGGLILTWAGAARLQAALDPSGPFNDLPAATSPHVIQPAEGPKQFYRLAVPLSP